LLYFANKEAKRRGQVKAATIGIIDYAKVVREANGICGFCRQPMNGEPAHIDHIIPICRGGAHAQENLQLTHARCNSRKGTSLQKVG
jgi:5-methylcytosine-specific restriction endonuclease McrA